MKKSMQIVPAILMMLCLTLPVSAAGYTGWGGDGETYWTYQIDGVFLSGWQRVDDVWYYFDGETHAMYTGWLEADGSWYYLRPGLGQMHTGWGYIDGKYYYFKDSGQMVTGWQKMSGQWYLFSQYGGQLFGWQEVEGYWYYLEPTGDSGHMLHSTTIRQNGVYYKLNQYGQWIA